MKQKTVAAVGAAETTELGKITLPFFKPAGA